MESSTVSFILIREVCNLQVMAQGLYSIHWNLISPHFLSIHKWTDKQHSATLDLLDTLAERVRALDVKIPTSLSDVFKYKSINEVCLFNSDQSDYQCLCALLTSTFQAQGAVKEAIALMGQLGDVGTQDVLIGVEQFLTKQIWFIKSLSIEGDRVQVTEPEVSNYE
jgi:starvation-inducible DNA-binding protein